jgi:hypothetical protein
MAGLLRLKAGIVKLGFDGGTDLILEGPARLDLHSGNSATLERGKVVLRKDNLIGPFSLHTTYSTFVDLGTEYAVSLDASGVVEVHVFDGVVIRKPSRTDGRTAESQRLAAGEALRYDPGPGVTATAIPLAEDRFVRLMPVHPRPDPEKDLLIYEGFDYSVTGLPSPSSGNGGQGWAEPWRSLNNKPGLLLFPGLPKSPLKGPYLQGTNQGQIGRKLHPLLRLDQDALYYIGFLFRQQVLDETPHINSLIITFVATAPSVTNQRKLRVGVSRGRYLIGLLAGDRQRVRIPLEGDRVYWLAAKIVAGRTNPDQLFATVYRADQPIDFREPPSWTLVCPPIYTDLVFDDLGIFTLGGSHHVIDELRIGTTWQSILPR